MKTRKQKETNEKEIHLLEHKGYERMMNEIMPVQQAGGLSQADQESSRRGCKRIKS